MSGVGDVLVIGAGVAGMKASLLLAAAGRRVHLVEKTSVTGGNIIRCEDIFTGMECATCMVSPMQQDVLRNDLINVITLGRVTSVEGTAGSFKVTVSQTASCVDPVACIGCGECWGACPVEIPNRFEEGMTSRKAISVPCAGALPNVPWIDRYNCRRWTGEDSECTLCADSCVFEAIDYSQENRDIVLEVSDIIVATGFELPDPELLSPMGWGKSPGVYTAFEFERLYASNGPTSGELILRDGRIPSSAAVLVHADPGGNVPFDHISSLCCLKFVHYIRKKLPDAVITLLYDNLCTPGTAAQRFHEKIMEEGAGVVRFTGTPRVSMSGTGEKISISCTSGETTETVETDMLILFPRILPSEGTLEISCTLGLETGDTGFPETDDDILSPGRTRREGISLVGSAGGPADIAACTVSAAAAVASVLSGSAGSDS